MHSACKYNYYGSFSPRNQSFHDISEGHLFSVSSRLPLLKRRRGLGGASAHTSSKLLLKVNLLWSVGSVFWVEGGAVGGGEGIISAAVGVDYTGAVPHTGREMILLQRAGLLPCH